MSNYLPAGPDVYAAQSRLFAALSSVSGSRIATVLLSVMYFGAFAWAYVSFVADIFGGLGFGFAANWQTYDFLIVAFIALLPSFWIPTRFERPSAVFIYIQYFLIYIPAIWMTRHSILPVLEPADRAILCGALAVSMAVLLWAHHRLPLISLTTKRLTNRDFWSIIFGVTGLLLGVLAIELGRNFHLVGLADIYSLRSDASDLLDSSGDVVAKYAFTWLNAFLLPLIFARALARSNHGLALGVTACFVFLYGIWGSKASLFSPLILAATNIWASRGASRTARLMIVGLIFALIGPFLLPSGSGIVGLIKLAWISVVDMRTFSIPGLALTQYYDFFANHPLTLGSHITGVNLVVRYPYDYDIPRIVGFYYNGVEITANANFWAQDGLAGFGPIGVVAVSFFVAGILWLLDSATRGLDRRFVLTGTVGILLLFANVSIFTTLVTGGLALFILACIAMPRSTDGKSS
jgi:hypothetical protein